VKLNLWPSNEEGRLEQYGLIHFEKTLKTFYQSQSELAGKVMHLICRAMGADPQDLDEIFGDAHMSASRLNYYPSEDPIPETERQSIAALGELALGEHTDPNGITLLFQDNVGGLQAFSADAGWIDVEPVPYSFVVNIGDVMQAWSNDRYTAAQHRVKAVPKDTPRISIPYFHMPKSGAVIKTIIKDENPHYRDFIWDEYLIARLEDNYAVIEREDTQISDYRI
jgi:isopenicillin N synthase-like dioxygenase